jgi:peptidyl-dipeptidase Dcp
VFALKAFSPRSPIIMSTSITKNPLLEKWTFPPFEHITSSHFKPAIEQGFNDNIERIAKIVAIETSNFDNTIAAFDKAAPVLSRVLKIFYNLCSSNSPPELQSVEREMSGPMAVHKMSIYTYPGLFTKIDKIYEIRLTLNLSPEELRLVETIHTDFIRAGARLDAAAQARVKEIAGELAQLMTEFNQNVMADEGAYTLFLETQDDLKGLPDFVLEAAKSAAEEKKLSGHVITLSRSLVVPFLTFSERRDLREKAFKAWISRGELSEATDNKELMRKILLLRAEQAKIHGYSSYAEFNTVDTMAKHPTAVMDLLERVWTPAKESAAREKAALQEFMQAWPESDRFDIEPWDWRFLAEKVRVQQFNVDEASVKPYFPLNRMVEAVFDCANKLFGIRFILCPDIKAYHPDVKVYEVRETISNGEDLKIGLFLHDNYSRQYKRSGAWMSDYRSQSRNNNDDNKHITPIIVNNNNFAKSIDTLLSFDDAVTLFHEFGHGLHGLLSDVRFNRLAGTNVLKDFVELPSQLFEHWILEPTVLKKHALHYKTQEPIPDELLDKVLKAKAFNQGFATVEYTICALIDQSIHQLNAQQLETIDLEEFEQSELRRLGMPCEIVPRHRLPHFLRKAYCILLT